ncbi:hypothetical protein Pelo_783 [Pelomyxa schiedti]|nr:hypothetical protein Pelo_783 [Pelomyxa schiedti]
MTAPKIRIEGVEVNSITGNGLVFFASGKSQSLCVMEPSSSGGTVVACVEFLSPGCQKMEELITSSSCHFCSGNEKWWLHFDDLRTLTIANLIVGVEEGATSVISSRFEIQLLIHDEATANVLKCQGIFFNMKITDEAMLLMHDSVAELDLIVLIDIKNTFVTKKLSLLSFTKCLGQGEIVAGIFMIKSTGQHIFFVMIHLAEYFDLMRPAVYEVAEGTGTRKSLSNDVESLSQLSSFLFCILKCDTSAEIWDCNNTSAALRVIASSISRLDVQSWPPVVAGPFLIATRHDHSHFEVVEASTGAKITTISLGSMIGMFDAVAFM